MPLQTSDMAGKGHFRIENGYRCRVCGKLFHRSDKVHNHVKNVHYKGQNKSFADIKADCENLMTGPVDQKPCSKCGAMVSKYRLKLHHVCRPAASAASAANPDDPIPGCSSWGGSHPGGPDPDDPNPDSPDSESSDSDDTDSGDSQADWESDWDSEPDNQEMDNTGLDSQDSDNQEVDHSGLDNPELDDQESGEGDLAKEQKRKGSGLTLVGPVLSRHSSIEQLLASSVPPPATAPTPSGNLHEPVTESEEECDQNEIDLRHDILFNLAHGGIYAPTLSRHPSIEQLFTDNPQSESESREEPDHNTGDPLGRILFNTSRGFHYASELVQQHPSIKQLLQTGNPTADDSESLGSTSVNTRSCDASSEDSGPDASGSKASGSKASGFEDSRAKELQSGPLQLSDALLSDDPESDYPVSNYSESDAPESDIPESDNADSESYQQFGTPRLRLTPTLSLSLSLSPPPDLLFSPVSSTYSAGAYSLLTSPPQSPVSSTYSAGPYSPLTSPSQSRSPSPSPPPPPPFVPGDGNAILSNINYGGLWYPVTGDADWVHIRDGAGDLALVIHRSYLEANPVIEIEEV